MSQELVIRDLTIWGEGVGSLNGLTCFIDGALPGEKVLVEGVEKKGTYAKARVQERLETSPNRVRPICPVFGKCGGCQIMHLAYEEQCKMKQKRVVDAFERIGKLKDFIVHMCVPSPKPLYYRNKIGLPVEDGKIGLYAKRSHTLVPIEKCYIQNESANETLKNIRLIPSLRHVLIKANHKGELLAVLVTRDAPDPELRRLAKEILAQPLVKGVLHGYNPREDNVLASDAYTLLEGEGTLREELLGIEVEISPASFFQVNLPQAEAMYQKAFQISGLSKGDKAVDAYCGVGLFAIYLARHGIDTIGIEVVPAAVADAKRNAGKTPVDFRLGMVEDLIGDVGAVDVVFLNPPRKGCEASGLEATARINPKKIIYTSCDPATLARDLQILQSHGYTKVEAYPFDMFPQTMHVETVAAISKNG